MTQYIADIFELIPSVFGMIVANPLFSMLIGVIVIAFIAGIVTSVFNSRRRGRKRG